MRTQKKELMGNLTNMIGRNEMRNLTDEGNALSQVH